MAYVGLFPSENSSGSSRRLGGITKTGNGHGRRILIESAWHDRRAPRMTKALRARNEGAMTAAVRTIAWKAQQRLHARLKKLSARGKPRNQAVAAVWGAGGIHLGYRPQGGYTGAVILIM